MQITTADKWTDALAALFTSATDEASTQRGGATLIATIQGTQTLGDVLDSAISNGDVVVAIDGAELLGFALCRRGVLEAVYVLRERRREGVARALVNAVLAQRDEILDAYALPGDRATKSLYESFGWKARLLTMRAE